jgi:anti-sigma28 factor (negative regulator of flagellin synthesis)
MCLKGRITKAAEQDVADNQKCEIEGRMEQITKHVKILTEAAKAHQHKFAVEYHAHEMGFVTPTSESAHKKYEQLKAAIEWLEDIL